MSLAQLDAALMAFIVGTYNQRPHSQIDEAPLPAWLGKGWLPRMPDSLDDLDLLLMTVAKARTVQRDGIHFQGLRYIDTTLAAYVGESVTIRFDPRDVSEIRIFHRNRFLCRTVSPEYADRAVTLKDIETARKAFRRSLRSEIRERVGRVLDFYRRANPHPSRRRARPPRSRSCVPTSRAIEGCCRTGATSGHSSRRRSIGGSSNSRTPSANIATSGCVTAQRA